MDFMNKFMKVLLVFVYAMLAVFCGIGVYFLIKGVTGTGFVSLGIFLAGLGAIIFLQVCVMDDDVAAASPKKKRKNKNAVLDIDDMVSMLDVNARIVRLGEKMKSANNGIVRFYDEILALEGLYPRAIVVNYKDVQDCVSRGESLILTIPVNLTGTETEMSQFEIIPANNLKRKAFIQVFSSKTGITFK